MMKEIKVIGLANYEYTNKQQQKVPMVSVHFIYESEYIEGNGVGKFNLTAKDFDKFGIALGSVGKYYYSKDYNTGREQFVYYEG